MNNLVIIDTKAIQYMILADYENSISKFNYQGDLRTYTRIQLLYLKSCAWLSRLDTNPCKVLFVDDSKPYWRHEEFANHGINYKANRNKNPLKQKYLGDIDTLFVEHSVNTNHNILSFYGTSNAHGYEADDIAAAVINLFYEQFKNIYCLTVDSDWLPFTHFHDIKWVNAKTSFTTPRVLNTYTAYDHFKTANKYNKTVAQRAFERKSILDLWKFKAVFGDSADNIPADPSMKLVSLIDLFQPPGKFKLWENSKFCKLANEYIDNTPVQSPIDSSVFLEKVKTNVFMPGLPALKVAA